MNILLGLFTVFLCTVVQCAFTAGLKSIILRWNDLAHVGNSVWKMTFLLSGVTSFLFLGMMVQVFIWAVVFFASGETDGFRTAAYFSMVNFTSLGYGDITLSAERAILGPMEAANGILMLGLSTGALFSVLQKLNLTSKSEKERTPH